MPDNWKALQAGHHVSTAHRHTPNLRAMDRELGAGGVGVQVCALLFLDTLSPSLDSPDPKCLGPT